jgi:hypothetical protein
MEENVFGNLLPSFQKDSFMNDMSFFLLLNIIPLNIPLKARKSTTIKWMKAACQKG